jgi:hypothetical protein
MKSSVLGCLLVATFLPQLATSAPQEPPKTARDSPDIISGPPPEATPNFPIGYDIIEGNPLDGHIQRWIRYVVVGLRNHPIPIVFFSPHEFRPKTFLELLSVLSDSEYKSLSAFTSSQACTGQRLGPNNDQWRAGEITEHEGDKTTRCTFLPIDACNYLAGITELPDIRWTPAQLKLIHRITVETNCQFNNSNSSP